MLSHDVKGRHVVSRFVGVTLFLRGGGGWGGEPVKTLNILQSGIVLHDGSGK